MTALTVTRVPTENNPNGLLHRLSVDEVAGRIDQACGDEDQQVALGALCDLATEQASGDGDVAEKRNLVVDLRHVVTNQPAKHDGLAVPDYDSGHDIAGGKQRLLDIVGSCHASRGDGVTVVDETKEIRDLGDEGQVDRVPIGSNHWGHIEDHADRPS